MDVVLPGAPGVTERPDGLAPGASCQWPCSGDQTLPGGGGPGGWLLPAMPMGFEVADGKPSGTWFDGSPAGIAFDGSPAGAVGIVAMGAGGREGGSGRSSRATTTVMAAMARRATTTTRGDRIADFVSVGALSQQNLYFWPLPQGQGWLRPTGSVVVMANCGPTRRFWPWGSCPDGEAVPWRGARRGDDHAW